MVNEDRVGGEGADVRFVLHLANDIKPAQADPKVGGLLRILERHSDGEYPRFSVPDAKLPRRVTRGWRSRVEGGRRRNQKLVRVDPILIPHDEEVGLATHRLGNVLPPPFRPRGEKDAEVTASLVAAHRRLRIITDERHDESWLLRETLPRRLLGLRGRYDEKRADGGEEDQQVAGTTLHDGPPPNISKRTAGLPP